MSEIFWNNILSFTDSFSYDLVEICGLWSQLTRVKSRLDRFLFLSKNLLEDIDRNYFVNDATFAYITLVVVICKIALSLVLGDNDRVGCKNVIYAI